ncbi:MAG: cbb3-type cytochrome oxidase assembly protein CcoS [Azonexus sp.]|nr:cbb3-type cytochrome oxidase assembly protein CcoS [Betaproteobacteria bacterium]MBK8918748.1 cbb3-type cytochrome oxidase assembly protein CcoS [Betaproteobacteria bacterium]MBP6034681.1 cbb3-type cytochrome oxidase assembly protein CcoS [Azonexus sp.]MBP6905221.1 cbb3-type cytochrome oxidase assembly protein CcoS [Azonexus sp.]
MESLYLLIPLSVVLVFLIAWLFWWSVKSGQFDDLEGPGFRVLMDDDREENVPESGERKISRGKGAKTETR